jgi:hypothetical protein
VVTAAILALSGAANCATCFLRGLRANNLYHPRRRSRRTGCGTMVHLFYTIDTSTL